MRIRQVVREWSPDPRKKETLRTNWPKVLKGGLSPDLTLFVQTLNTKDLREAKSVQQGVEYFFNLFEATQPASLIEYITYLHNAEGLMADLYTLPVMNPIRAWSLKMNRGITHLVKYLRIAKHARV